MTQTVLTKSGVEAAQDLTDSEPFYPQCYLYQPDEVELQRNLTKLDIALFLGGASTEAAHQAAKVITNIKPGFIISRAEYLLIQQALREMK
ncbi:MAG: hypothetical protein F6K21_07775 [Symploca sp. SIO2D2]|nr:hypothetical protein [Symploca sp. SIO2D2]